QLFDVTQQEDFAVNLSQAIESLRQQISQFAAFQFFARNFPPVSEFTRSIVSFFVRELANRFKQIRMPFSLTHPRLVDGDLNQPSAESRIAAELAEMRECFQNGLLRNLLGVSRIAEKT